MSFKTLAAFVAACAAALVSTSASATSCPTSNVIEDPADFSWTYHPVTAGNPEAYYSGTLEIGEETFTFGSDTLTTRAYGQAGGSLTIPGPTLRVTPGNKYVLRFHNTLDYEALETSHNTFKDPNVSNIHTHGLHISGESPSDDVTRNFEGGYGGDFVYDIPSDHMGGTYWYHAHHHGSTFLQVSGGAFGLLLVDDSNDGMPTNVSDMTERQLVVAYLDPAAAGTGGDTLLSGTLSSTWTVNGKVNGTLCSPADEWQHWRVLLADRDARSKTIEVGSSCEVQLLARDGVWRTEVPKELTTNQISITGASRADLAVRCSGDSTLSVDGTTVADIYVDGTGDTSVHPWAADGSSTWNPTRPDYLRDLQSETTLNSESVSMGARTINGSKFDEDTATFTLNADSVQEWSISGAKNHPFHLHVYHMQSQNCGGDFEDGEYYDVIDQNCDVRFDLDASTTTSYEGRTIMHCHILAHEDQGAMGWLDVVGGSSPPSYPSDGDIGESYSEYYSIGSSGSPPTAPSALSATTVSSSEIDLDWTDNSSDEDGFDVERSEDGISFDLIDSVPADTTTYSDTGLSAETTYDYQVSAYNSAGSSSASNVASATTDPAPSGTDLAIGSITVTTQSAGKGFKFGRAVVEVIDDVGNVVSDAVVAGEFTGTFTETVTASDPTDASGLTTMDTTGTAKGSVSVTFCVTEVTHATLTTYTPSAGSECGSN